MGDQELVESLMEQTKASVGAGSDGPGVARADSSDGVAKAKGGSVSGSVSGSGSGSGSGAELRPEDMAMLDDASQSQNIHLGLSHAPYCYVLYGLNISCPTVIFCMG